MPKVSIIIPVYGVEKYIERCARSLFEQTFDDIEYIFVNDCTKDNSIKVLETVIEDYPNRKEQVKILCHETNKGLPQARKTGILAASGEYLINFDSDDWVDVYIIEVLYNKAVKDGTDIVICDIYTTDGEHHTLLKCGIEGIDKWDFFEQMCQMKLSWSTCNKLIKRTLFKEVIFPMCNNAEDMALILQLMAKADKVGYLPEPLYFYYSNPQSMSKLLTEEQILKNIKDRKANNEIVFDILKKVFPNDKYQKFVEMFRWQVKKLAWAMIVIDKKHYNYWKSIHSEINLSLFFNRYITIEDKFKCLLTILRIYPSKRELGVARKNS